MNINEVKIEQTAKLVDILKSFGYEVYLSESKTYGLFCKLDGKKIISFSSEFFFFHFTANHKSENLGTGYRITENEQCLFDGFEKWATGDFFEGLLNCKPYISRKKNERFLSWTTLEEHLKIYGASSKYVKQ